MTIIKDFFTLLDAEGLSDGRKYKYLYHLKDLLKWANKDLIKLNEEDLIALAGKINQAKTKAGKDMKPSVKNDLKGANDLLPNLKVGVSILRLKRDGILDF